MYSYNDVIIIIARVKVLRGVCVQYTEYLLLFFCDGDCGWVLFWRLFWLLQFNNDKAIIDSGTTDIFLPKDVYEKVEDTFKGYFEVRSNCSRTVFITTLDYTI